MQYESRKKEECKGRPQDCHRCHGNCIAPACRDPKSCSHCSPSQEWEEKFEETFGNAVIGGTIMKTTPYYEAQMSFLHSLLQSQKEVLIGEAKKIFKESKKEKEEYNILGHKHDYLVKKLEKLRKI